MQVLARLVVLVLAIALATWAIVARPQMPAAERGRRLAEREGCFTCHGPGGLRGAANHGRLDRSVPGFQGDVMMYARDDADIQSWIHDGVTKRKAESLTWRSERDRGALRMPAFGRRLNTGQIDDLVAYVNASAGNPEPGDSLAKSGLDRAEKLGCVGCHGPGGRLSARNPGSLKGYVPAWDSPDFDELVRNRREFHEWVEQGISERFRGNAAARFFLERAVLRMPAYRTHLAPGDEDALWAYVQWLRRTPH